MIDASPALLLRAAAQLSRSLATCLPQFPRQIRFGASAGVIIFEETEPGRTLKPNGLALLRAGRLEPLARAGSVLADNHFSEGAVEFGVSRSGFILLKPSDLPTLSTENGLFIISKPDETNKISTTLWSVEIDDLPKEV